MILFYRKGSPDSEKAMELLKNYDVTYVEENSNHELLKEYTVKVYPTLIFPTDDDVTKDVYYEGMSGIEKFLERKNEYY